MRIINKMVVAVLVMLPWGAWAETDGEAGPAIQLGLEYNMDLLSNASGGVSQSGAMVDTRSIGIDMNMQTLLGWNNTSMHFSYLYTNGGDIGAVVGSGGVSNIEAGAVSGKVYEFWFEHAFSVYRSLLFGLYDLNGEFDVTPAAGLFINGAFGMGNDIAQSGANGPSIFPVTSLALRYRSSSEQGHYYQVAVLDADPGTGYPRISWTASEGLLLVIEGGRSDGREGAPEGKLSYGAWAYTSALSQDAAGVALGAPSYNYGLYAMVNGILLQEGEHEDQGLAGFMRVGMANPSVNVYSAFTSVGLVYTGLIPGMDLDQLGVGLTISQTSQRYAASMAGMATPVDPFELVFEISYRNQFNDHLYVQPFTQMVFNPGLDPTIADARVYGIRMSLAF